MRKRKLLSLLVLLMTAVTGAWADGVSIKFEANGHEKVVDNVTLPYTFRCNYDSEDGELDRIIKEFYGISSGCCYQNSPTSDNSNVTAFLDGDNQCITIKSAFEGTAKVTGVYYDYDRDDIYYELTISVLSSGTPAPAGYSVTMKEGTEDATSWQGKAGEGAYQALPLEGVAAGTAVTVKYNGTKKVKSVTVVKKAAPADIVNPVVGQIIGSDGKNYDANATLPTGVTAVAKICYVGSETGEAAPYNHGLALALSDANDGDPCTWNTSFTDAGHTKQASYVFTEESGLQYNDTHNSDAYPAFKAAITYSPAAPTGCSSWFLPSGYQWQKMIGAAGLDNLGLTYGGYYWSSSEYDAGNAWDLDNYEGIWNSSEKSWNDQVRACLAF